MGYDKVNYMLGSTDAAERVLHPRPTWDATSDAVAHASLLHLSFFFFLPQIRTDMARFTPNRLQFASNRANSAKIGSYWPAIDTAEIGLETHRNHRNSDLRGVSCLLLSLFCESRHSNVFFNNILIVKIYRKYK